MNKKIFLIPAITAFFFSCSEADVLIDNNGEEQESEAVGDNTSYLNIAVVSNLTESRAEEYAPGTGNESKVYTVSFYFFDANDNAIGVKPSGNSYVSYMHISSPGVNSSASKPTGVETVLNPTLVINTENNDKIPSKVMAIINVPSKELPTSLAECSLANLQKIVKEYANDGTQQFVMSSSVFASGGKKMVAIDNLKVFKSRAEAERPENVNMMYVERVNAKVGLINNKLDINQKEGNLYKLIRASSKTTEEGETVAADEPFNYKGNPIYFQYLGWNVTHDRIKSYLIKDINPSWSTTTFGWDWNSTTRSFWAVNPAKTGSDFHNDYNNGDFRHAQHFTDFSDYTKSDVNWAYPQENAADVQDGKSPATKTKVIIAGQIVDERGEPLDVVDFNGMLLSADEVLNNFITGIGIYKDKEFTKELETTDVEFISKQKVLKKWQADGPRYLSCIQLNADAPATFYDSNGKDLTKENVNAQLLALGDFRYYNRGQTYWYKEIQHLGYNGFGDLGVVRNHWYLIELDKIYGLGTPVPDDPKKPDDPEEDLEKIDPEKPENADIFVASSINVLSWRVVTQKADLEW